MENTERTLKHMLADMEEHRRTRSTLFPMYIEKRLDTSIRSYYAELMQSYNALLHKTSNRSLKKIARGLGKNS